MSKSFTKGVKKMTNILLSSLQTAMADMVYYTSAYTEMYTLYVQEANKSSSEYNKKRADYFFHNSDSKARRAIQYALDLGLDPEVVCKDCVNFFDSYKGDWKKEVA